MSRKMLNNTYISMLCSELAMLLDAGLTISDSIQVLIDDEPDKEGKIVLTGLLESLENGESFSSALKTSGHFPRYMIHMVEVGELTGHIVEALLALSEYYERQARLATTIKNSVLYPAILLVLMIVVVVILIVQVLPIFNDVFSRLGAQMSPLATNLMRFGQWLGNVSFVIAIIFAVIFVVVFLMFVIPSLRKSVFKCLSNTFGHRGIFDKVSTSRFIFAMRLASASGLDINDAINAASSVSGGSKSIDRKHKRCVELLAQGRTLADALTESGILSPSDGKMLSIGDRSGKIDDALAEIARRSDIRTHDEIDRVVSKIEPTLVVLSSAMVGVILLSVMLPLMGIMTALG